MLNRSLKEERQEIISLRNLAKHPDKKDLFTKAINNFVDRVDEHVFQIGAGGLRDRLNETLRLTLLNWQPELPGDFEEIIFVAEYPITVKFEALDKDDAQAIKRELKKSHWLWKVNIEEKETKWLVTGQNVSLDKNDPELSKQMRLLSLKYNCVIV